MSDERQKPITLADIEKALLELDAKPVHIHRLYRAWMGIVKWPACDDERYPKRLREKLALIREMCESIARVASRHPGADPDSERLLIRLGDEQTVESVLLPRQGVCVSTQLGCAVGCVFCMTGRGGLIRQLTDAEIVAQAAVARQLRASTKKVVFMGMGEPSHNLDNVMRAMMFLADFGGFGHKELVISSVGDPRLFDRLMTSRVKPALAVSLHTVFDERRVSLLPHGTKMSVNEVMDAAEEWARVSGYPIQYQWTLIEGVNDSLEEAALLAQKMKGRYAMMNFIPVNAVPGSPWKRPTMAKCEAVMSVLRGQGIIATLRMSAAQDVDGGCGQLRARVSQNACLETQAGVG